MRKQLIQYGTLLLLSMGACKDRYTPSTGYPYTGYLVVEGFIQAGSGLTTFRLSRTTTLDSAFYRPEAGARLNVESENGDAYPLTETAPGVYSGADLPTQPLVRYRLRILTANARNYLSQFSLPRVSPAIDSVSWAEKGSGIQIYVSTHGAQNDTGYYKWRFDETWKYNARYFSALVYDPASPYSYQRFRNRTQDELDYTCWKSDTSSDILLGSTAQLSGNVLHERQVTFIPYSENYNKLYLRYSINVYMESLSADEYGWYDRLRKNTESLGSIFDAQPSELTGNIQSLSDPGETVIGWVGCRSVTQKRIFIGRQELPSNPALSRGYQNCELDTINFGPESDAQIDATYAGGRYNQPVSYLTISGAPAPVGIIGSSTDCTDCRVQGGVITEPSFWIE